MIKKTLLTLFGLIFIINSAFPQVLRKGSYAFDREPDQGLAGNGITDILIDGSTVWVGTGAGLSKTSDNGETWLSYGHSHGLGKGGISAIAVKDSLIWVATAFDTLTPDAGELPAGGGLSYSTNGGTTWLHVPQPGPTPVQNITYDIAIVIDTLAGATEIDTTLWITSWGGGLRKSTNMGNTWEVVTPDTFFFDPYGNLNHRAFSVIAVGKTLWVGTAGGINKSTDDGKTWTNFNHQNQPRPISGNFVVAIGHQKYGNKDVIWAATINAEKPGEFRAVSKTEDGGYTWTTTLEGEFAHNFAFDDSVVYVATDNGLFKSIDGGETWAVFPQIFDAITGEGIYTTEFYSAGVSSGHLLWAGSADGLGRTGSSWRVFRSFVPTGQKGTPRTYAYPNPFSPLRHNQIGGDGYVRFQYNATKSTRVTIKVYDFAMDLVKTVVEDKSRPTGDFSEVWNGMNEQGDPVANGVYFYRLELEGEGTFWGKLIILN